MDKPTWYKIDLPIYDTSLDVAFVRSHKELYKVALKDGAALTEKDKYVEMDGLFYYNKKEHKKSYSFYQHQTDLLYMKPFMQQCTYLMT